MTKISIMNLLCHKKCFNLKSHALHQSEKGLYPSVFFVSATATQLGLTVSLSIALSIGLKIIAFVVGDRRVGLSCIVTMAQMASFLGRG